MFLAILAGLLFAFAAPFLYRWLGRWVYVPMALLPFCIFLYLLSLAPAVLAGSPLGEVQKWAPSLGINLHFYLDGLSLLFALLITGFGTLIMVYAGGYLKGNSLLGRFYLYLTLFMTAMLGLVLSGNLISLFIFWELTSISSYLLIGFGHEQESSRNSALQALLVTGLGGLALMAGLILVGMAGETYTLSELLTRGDMVTSHALYLPALVLVLLGAFTKSAQFPFHFWLPNAMAAPTPVSAYLHSATMVKAGVYLLARLTPVMGGTEVWQYTLMIVGGITTLLGAWLALQHSDLKAILAYTTISALGLLVTMTGIGTAPALEAMLVFLLAHALYKGTLFLVAGNVDHATGTRDIKQLYGLARSIRPTAIAALLAGFSMAGVLPFFGFIGKELVYEAVLEESPLRWMLFAVSFFSGMVFVAVALLIGFRIFWGRSQLSTPLQHPDKALLYLPPVVLSLVGLLFGLLPGLLATPILRRAAQAMLGEEQVFELALWHGFNLVLGLSLLTIALGYVVYRFSGSLQSHANRFERLYLFGPDKLYQHAVKGLITGATKITATIQNGYLRNYIVTIVITHILLLALSLWKDGPALEMSYRLEQLSDIRLYELVLILLVIPALIFLFQSRSRLTSIAIMGIIGYSIALFYILFGAPDVAATQLLIETLTVVIFVLILHKLPAFQYLTHARERYKYVLVSIAFGAAMTYIILLVKQYPLDSPLKAYYGENSYLLGQGRNIVNVILVDFRALDTLGEIVVLAVAAVGIVAMLKLRMQKGGKP
ncbi:putative monovalent cation/H+ antiporter subunit A [Pontibacter sp. JH31]|uniref:Monovalent cation/H+ antiporter subunit A n=1 Tax=Pontibacter aquaedesilientis TaxID=2766980 RepID=A0ABR7XCQ5_9BACT|nr:putative monovalent cation/H+ antiporter subunit A [Pontibacter aquaedesilientis]MBD1396078.1 putative monovalent cation/H+ antiporter subunit A [Pontibacter aquaedesilientis]